MDLPETDVYNGVRREGAGCLEYYGYYRSTLGDLLLISDGTALTGLYLNRNIPQNLISLPVFETVGKWLEDYFQGNPRVIDFPFETRGTDFQKRVWKLLETIPYGETRTYGQIACQVAAELGKERMSAQAVGGAVGKNPISIVIPCHRVVGADGSMTGYAGGISNKEWLLEHEKGTER